MSKTPKTPKYRIFELAKEFNQESQSIVDFLKKRKIKVANRFSAVGEEVYNVLKEAFARRKPAAETETPAQEPPPAEKPAASKKTPAPKPAAKPAKPVEKAQPKPAAKPPAPKPKVEPVAQKPAVKPAPKPAEKPVQKPAPKPQLSAAPKSEEKPKPREFRRERPAQPLREESKRVEIKAERPAENRSEHERTERKNRDSSREDGNRAQNRSRNRRNKNAASAAKSQQQAQTQAQPISRPARPKKKFRQQPAPVHKAEIARPTHIKIGSSIIVKDLASKMSCTAADIIKKLLLMGVIATINQEVDFDTAALVASEFGVTAEELPPEVDPTLIPEIEDDPKSLKPRPPVVTVMGHVDHGKTSLLDAIRQSSVTSTEAGGITQHIGAYQVMCNDRKIVFLDTPGHEAFTAMRARGAQVTDVAVLVVAADDGVMPQTIEAINHAKAANVPILVAINKIDKPGANPMKVKQELMEYELVSDDYGGNTVMVEVSAKKRINLNLLLEMILLVADMQELKANPNRDARGVIIEAQLDKGRGPVATVLVQNGTLRIGDHIVAGTTFGRVRAMINDRGDNVKKAGPSVPVEVLGLNDVPAAGDILAALDEKTAKSIAEHRLAIQRTELIKSKKVSLDDLFNQIKAGTIKDLNIVVKADVQGSIEALSGSLLALNKTNDEVHVKIVHAGVGAVNEGDVMLASAANALILAFNVRPDANARRAADNEHIDIRTYRVIYDAIGDVKAAMSGMLAPKYKEVVQGRVEIRKVMKFSKALVAGSYVLEGKIFNNSKIRLLRDNVEIYDGAIDSLRRFKDEVKEVASGYECGISIVDFRDFKEGDIIEAYTMEEIKTTIDG